MNVRIMLCICFFLFAVPQNTWAQNSELLTALETIKTVDVGGQGHDQAIKALAILNQAGADDVPAMLGAMQGANKLALNWLRGAIQTALAKGPLPRKEIESYLNDTSGSHMGRLMAFELLSDFDDSYAKNNVARMLQDPSLPVRQLAVADLIVKAQAAEEPSDAVGMLAYALPHTREVDQVMKIVKMLSERGIQIDLQNQLGFVANWHIVGPFDNTGETGFNTAMGPEIDPANIDIEATFNDSKSGESVSWISHNTLDPTGSVDVNKILGSEKGVVAYAYNEFNSEEEQNVEIRIGCINGNKVWLNGVEILSNEIYHVGMMPDQFVGKATLQKGANSILFKVCQNEQTEAWANLWAFQLRVCQADGKAVAAVKAATPR